MYLTQKQFSYFIVFFISLLAYWAILRSPLLYADDAVRVYTYLGINQGVHGRPLADMLYLFFTGGLFIDFSPFTQVIALMAMTWAGFLLSDVFYTALTLDENGINTKRCAIALMFTVFPLNFGLISYRFDALPFGVAVLCATGAFVKVAKISLTSPKVAVQYLVPGVLLACSLALYQPMFGIYACCTVLYLCQMLLQNSTFHDVRKKFFTFFAICLVGALLYLPAFFHLKYMLRFDHYGLGPHPYVIYFSKMPELLEFPKVIWNNIIHIFSTLKTYIGLDVPSITAALFIAVFIGLVLTQKIDRTRKLLVLLGLPSALVVCFGLQLFLIHPIIEPRTSTPLAAFTACLFALTLLHAPNFLIKKGLLLFCAVFILSSATILSSIGNAQRDQYRYETEFVYQGLEADLKALYTQDGLKTFYITPFESPICTTLQVLRHKYGFLKSVGSMSTAIFGVHRILSYLPVDYNISHIHGPDADVAKVATDISKLETVISRYSYSIKKQEPGKFVIVLNDITPQPFTFERWK